MARILVIRFSALGDVAMTVPVLASFAMAHPEHEVMMLSRSWVSPLFEYLPENVHFYGVNLNDYKGVGGLYRLFKNIRSKYHFDYVADLHDVLRSQFLRFAFMLTGIPVAHVDKGHKEKKQLVRSKNKVLKPLEPMIQRYADVFTKLGFSFEVNTSWSFFKDESALSRLKTLAENDPFFKSFQEDGIHRIGIAPFAQHEGKVYSLEKMKQVVAGLDIMDNTQLYLFGAGDDEGRWCESIANSMHHVVSMVGRYKLGEELLIMNQLDVMLTMDSANMHLASICGTPTVAIWGATHPYAGFTGFQQKGSVNVQLEMNCRPCSVFGNKPCINKLKRACLDDIKPEQVINTIKQVINQKEK